MLEKVEDGITGQASQERCIYAWGRVRVWTMTHIIPERECKVKFQIQSETTWLRFLEVSECLVRVRSPQELRARL